MKGKNLSYSAMAAAGALSSVTERPGWTRTEFYRDLLTQAKYLRPGAKNLHASLQKCLERCDSEENVKQLLQLQAAAESPTANPEAYKAMNRIMIEVVTNYVKVMTNPALFFEDHTLADDEQPYIENRTMQELKVRLMGVDGGWEQDFTEVNQSRYPVRFKQYATPLFEYPLRNLETGACFDRSLANVDLGYDLMTQIAMDLWPGVMAACASFVTNNADPERKPFVLNSHINAANIPTTNVLVTPGNSTSTNFRKASLTQIMKYASSWTGTSPEMTDALQLVAVHLPSSDVASFLDDVDVDSEKNELTDQIFQRGHIYRFGQDKEIVLVGDPTLDPNEGVGYCQFNRTIGHTWQKPGLDMDYTHGELLNAQAVMRNRGVIGQSKVYASAIVEQQRMFVASIKYRNAS